MRSSLKLLLTGVVTLAGLLFIAAPVDDASALSINAYGTGVIDGRIREIRNYSEAVSFLNAYCARANAHPIMVVAYPTNVILDESNGPNGGLMTYSSNVVWRSCGIPGKDTRAAAIMGYPRTDPGSIATCPDAGTYALPQTYDCVKYTGSDSGHMGGYAAMGCPNGTGYDCVTGGSNPSGLFRSQVEDTALQPSTSPQQRTYSMDGRVPDWGTVGRTTGSYPFAKANAYCTFWKYNSAGPWGNPPVDAYGDCSGLSIYVEWSRYDLRPSVSSTATGSLEAPKNNFPVTGSVLNGGGTSRANTPWRLTQIVYRNAGAIPAGLRNLTTSGPGVLPCTHATGEDRCTDVSTGQQAFPSGNTPFARGAAIETWPVGTNICFMMSVRQYTQSTEDWRHSPLICYKVGIKPKVNVLGGDLIIRGPTTGVVVSTSTSEDASTGRTYGSWVEYGLVASGVVNGMASGAGYAGGASSSDLCRQSLLTFKNYNKTGVSGSCSIGGYSVSTNTAPLTSRFPVDGTRIPNGSSISPTSLQKKRVHTVNGSSLTLTAGTMAVGDWVVINAPNTNVTISGNLNYSNSPIPNIKSIPQLIIIARNISIQDSVTNIDAWLVAPNGAVNTCSRVPNNYFANAGADKSILSSRICNNPLTVNGPVIAGNLYMYRTGNTGSGADSGKPSEVFNLRPDAYLWSIGYNGGDGRVPTIETKDLPPRY